MDKPDQGSSETSSRRGMTLPNTQRLIEIVARLRAPDGCPWDREQTLDSLKPCLVEEAYELLEVMAGQDLDAHAEELGDVLLQVAMQARLREETGAFDFEEVSARVCEKLVRRHPHVFGAVRADSTEEVLGNWERIKRDEGKDDKPRSALAGVPQALPALLRAQRVQSKAARVGFDWSDSTGPREKVAEELAELTEAEAAGDRQAMHDEMGDVLFSVVNVCRFLKIDAESALRAAVERFSGRFCSMESALYASGRDPGKCSLDEWDHLWREAKATPRRAPE